MAKKIKTLKPISQRKYLKNPCCCPFCDSVNTDGENVDINEGSANQEVSCVHCGSVWIDTYKLVGYDVKTAPETRVKCSLCGEPCNIGTAHIHQDDWIGDECCWDERLRASE